MELRCFGLTTRSIKGMVFDLAIKMVLPVHCYCNKEKQAGSGCENLCAAILKPHVTSTARVKGLTKINVGKFFAICEPMLRLINISSHCLLNYEETGLNVVQHKACKVISLKGKRRISLS
jgi:hypothetical protein